MGLSSMWEVSEKYILFSAFGDLSKFALPSLSSLSCKTSALERFGTKIRIKYSWPKHGYKDGGKSSSVNLMKVISSSP